MEKEQIEGIITMGFAVPPPEEKIACELFANGVKENELTNINIEDTKRIKVQNALRDLYKKR